ncbi:hypothetical protein D3C76_794410 [compost metagenome]
MIDPNHPDPYVDEVPHDPGEPVPKPKPKPEQEQEQEQEAPDWPEGQVPPEAIVLAATDMNDLHAPKGALTVSFALTAPTMARRSTPAPWALEAHQNAKHEQPNAPQKPW